MSIPMSVHAVVRQHSVPAQFTSDTLVDIKSLDNRPSVVFAFGSVALRLAGCVVFRNRVADEVLEITVLDIADKLWVAVFEMT